jgi:hypothetical protein
LATRREKRARAATGPHVGTARRKLARRIFKSHVATMNGKNRAAQVFQAVLSAQISPFFYSGMQS